MSARTAESVVEIEVTEGGVEIVEPHQADDPTAEPNAFRVAGRAVDGLLGFDELVGLALIIFLRRRCVGVGGIAGLLLGLILRTWRAALGESAAGPQQKGKACYGEVAQTRVLQLKQPSTHAFPDMFLPRGTFLTARVMPSK